MPASELAANVTANTPSRSTAHLQREKIGQRYLGPILYLPGPGPGKGKGPDPDAYCVGRIVTRPGREG